MLAQRCEFGITKDEYKRDRFVIGIQNNDVSQKLQLEFDLTLEIAIKLARQSKQVNKLSGAARLISRGREIRPLLRFRLYD